MGLFLVIGLLAGFYMAWNIGANDLANAMGTIYGSGALKFKQIVILGSILNIGGAVLFGSMVVETIGKGLVSEITIEGAIACLLAAGVFITLATRFKMPVSTTHSVVGAVLGYGLISVGAGEVNWMVVSMVILAWVLSPLAGMGMGYLIYRFIRESALKKVENPSKAGKLYHFLHIMSSSYESFAHGSNDVANSVALLGVVFAGGLSAEESLSISPWVLLFGGIGIAIGLATLGRRVMDTIGKRITRMTYPRGYGAEFSAATTVLICSYFGMPVSTTHTSVGTVTGVGLARGSRRVNLRVLGKIVISWALTLPIAMAFSIAFYELLAVL